MKRGIKYRIRQVVDLLIEKKTDEELIKDYFDIDYDKKIDLKDEKKKKRIKPNKDELHADIFEIFYAQLKEIYSFDTTLFENNFHKLKIKYEEMNKHAGIFGYENNRPIIKLDNNSQIETIYHELLHFSSSLNKGNITRCGFHLTSKNFSVGFALNEGYTELLVRRYFKRKTINRYSYLFERKYANIIQRVIGEDKMTNFYSKARLDLLINELKKYNMNKKEIILFLKNYDFISRFIKTKKAKYINQFTQSFKLCNDFILKLILNKFALSKKSNDDYDNLLSNIQLLYAVSNITSFADEIGIDNVEDYCEYSLEELYELIENLNGSYKPQKNPKLIVKQTV